jgi:hypothetical protein
MKYWNKDVRIRCWTKVKRPLSWTKSKAPKSSLWAKARIAFPELQPDIKRWCQQQPSKGKFYFYHASEYIWFEKPEDAVLFLMKWS